jgi:hypothetical protein
MVPSFLSRTGDFMKEPVWVSFKILSQHLQEGAEWNYKPLGEDSWLKVQNAI